MKRVIALILALVLFLLARILAVLGVTTLGDILAQALLLFLCTILFGMELKAWKKVFAILPFILCLWAVIPAAMDLFHGPETITLSLPQVTRYPSLGLFLGGDTLVTGYDGSGTKLELSCTGDVPNPYPYTETLTVTYYPYTKEIIK